MKTVDPGLGTSSIGKLILRLSIPSVTAQFVNMLYNLVDRMYIGHMPGDGALALTGMGVCMPVILLISAFASLISMGSAPRASIAMGAGDNKRAERILGGSAGTLLVVSLALTAFFLAFGEPLLLLFGASKDTIGYALDYMNIYTLGTIFVQFALGLNAFITAQGFATTSMLTVLIGAVTNIVLDPIFIFTFGMGVRGAALATIISQGISAAWVVLFLCGKKTTLKLRLQNLLPSPKIMLPCIALGLSPFIMQSTESILNICFNSSLQRYGGDLAVGSMTILSSVMQFVLLPLQGLTQGSQPIVSYNYGARNPDRVKKAFSYLVKLCLGYSLLMWAVAEFAPQLFILVFTQDAALTEFTKTSLRIYMACTCIFGIQIACQQTFIAIGNAKTSLFLAVLRKILLLIPLIYLLPHLLGGVVSKTTAVFLAEPVADLLAVATTATLFYRQFGRAMRQLEEPKNNTQPTEA